MHDRWGREVAHGDPGHPEWRVLLEYGPRRHAHRDLFGRDVDRCSIVAADGWLVPRLAARHLGGPTVVERTRRPRPSRTWRPDAG